jgi:dTDP-4-amino-4,6-dideoxygalactose transaminase
LAEDVSRDDVATKVRACGIGVNIGTFASHVQPVYGQTEPCPISRRLFDCHLAIPMHANLTDAEVERVATELLHAVSCV